jgi:hypothetical protein
MADGQLSTRYQQPPSAERRRSAGLDLERRLTAVLGNSAGATAAELRELLQTTEEGIILAEEEAAVAQARALDPTVTPDPSAARAYAEDTALAAGRLSTLHGRLLRRVTEVEATERLRQWQRDFSDLKKERDALADEFAALYPRCVSQLTDLFARVVAFDQKASKLHQARPAGVALHIDSPELTARKLERVTRDVPSLLTAVTLYDFHNGKQIWPPVQKRDMSLFAPVVIADAAHSPDWWRPEVQAARNAEAKAEAERVREYYERQAREREEREKHAAKP